jgi:hypothetical protein
MTDQAVGAVEADELFYRMSALESSAVLHPVLERAGRSLVNNADARAFVEPAQARWANSVHERAT